MRKRITRCMIAGIVIGCTWTIPAVAARWVIVSTTDEAVRYVDEDTIVHDGTTATIWLKTEYVTVGKRGQAFAVEKWMHDCLNDRLKLLALTVYKSNGRVIVSGEEPRYDRTWEQVIPGSIGEEIHQYVCRTSDVDKRATPPEPLENPIEVLSVQPGSVEPGQAPQH